MRIDPDMLVASLTLVPVGLVLGLLAFGDHGGPRLRPTPGRIAAVGLSALLLGPVAVGTLGVLMWLLCVALVVSLMTMVVVLRAPRQPAPR